jgi:pimeloyl-ACP methyl ester carboxylesterase
MNPPSNRIVTASGAELCTQAFGDPGSAPVLLVMGQMASMLWWPDDLCRRIAEQGRYVLRYDNRDTGASTAYPPGEPAYGADDLVRDPVAVLDGYGIERAHVAGMSAGGAVAQLLAANFPDRVLTLTLISTTDAGGPPAGLPGPSAGYLEHAGAFSELDWSDAGAIADMLVAESRALTGIGREFDAAATREFVARDLARTRSPASLQNHALLADGSLRGSVADVDAPVLVIHGTADPLFPFEHGAALASAARDGELVALEGGGHELHRSDWSRIAEAVVRHTGV